MKLPKDCGDSSFCKVTKTILGPDVLFRITAAIPELGIIDVAAGFRNIRLTENVWFSRIDLMLTVNRFLYFIESLSWYFLEIFSAWI